MPVTLTGSCTFQGEAAVKYPTSRPAEQEPGNHGQYNDAAGGQVESPGKIKPHR